MPNQENERLTISVVETAKILGISRGLCYQMIHEGRIPHLAFGRRILIPKAGLQRLLDGQEGDINTSNITKRVGRENEER